MTSGLSHGRDAFYAPAIAREKKVNALRAEAKLKAEKAAEEASKRPAAILAKDVVAPEKEVVKDVTKLEKEVKKDVTKLEKEVETYLSPLEAKAKAKAEAEAKGK